MTRTVQVNIALSISMLSVSTLISACGGAPSERVLPDGTYTKMVSINGKYDPAHPDQVDVKPGDVVSVTADTITASGGVYAHQGRAVEDFAWSADDRQNDACDAGVENANCLSSSNFEVTDFGVNYYVPYNVGASITLHVRSREDANLYDTVVLHNALYGAGYVAPNVVVSDPADYHYATFDASLALAGQGRFVSVSGARYFVPYTEDANWQPYQNGYWNWVDGDGWTWVSYDSWGWYTDHYGTWRHHGVYGWVWEEYDDHNYRPASVTFVYDNDHIGWYPYYDGYRAAYSMGFEEGFDDGYWAGFSLGASFHSDTFFAGFTFVGYSDFGAENILNVRISDRDTCTGLFEADYTRSHRWPGSDDLGASRGFMNGHSAHYETARTREANLGGRHCRYPEGPHARPAEFRRHIDHDERLERVIPVGSTVHHDGNGHVSYEPPTTNGHGISNPPHLPHNGHMEPAPPMSHHPSEPNPNNGHVPHYPSHPGNGNGHSGGGNGGGGENHGGGGAPGGNHGGGGGGHNGGGGGHGGSHNGHGGHR